MAFRELYSELQGWVSGIGPQLAQKLVNKAVHDVFDYRLWSFNTREAALLAPALVSTGTVSVTQYSNSITFNAAAITALNAIPLSTPVTKQQFRITGGGGPIYSINAWNSVTGVATLDRVFDGATNATAGYQIYQCYYPAPESGFFRWISVYDPIQAYAFPTDRLHYAKSDFDRWDPQRGSQGNPYYLGWFRYGQSGQVTVNLPMFEMWPHPIAQVAYQTLYQVRGADLVADTDALPFAIPDELVLNRAKYRAAEWAEMNKGSHAHFQKTNWLSMMIELNAEYYGRPGQRGKLADAVRNDSETFLTNYSIKWRARFGFPMTGAWLAAHDPGIDLY